MLRRNIGRGFALGIMLMVVSAGIYAQQTVYKWVDEEGVVHFSDAPPDESQSVEARTLTTAKSQPDVSPALPAAKSAAPSAADDDDQSRPPEEEIPLSFETIDIPEMSIAELDLRCEEAREKMIAPMREAEITKCKQDQRNDPAWCERFNADFGDGGRTVSGTIRPRMFDDLPECVDALQEQHRRGR